MKHEISIEVEAKLRELQKDIVRKIDNAHGWGDGFQDAYDNILRNLKKAYILGRDDWMMS